MPGKWRLTITEDFSASHQLRNYEGKCERLHGHNFGVEVCVEGDKLDDKIEYVMDFKEIKAITREVLQDLDHRHLNEVPPFDAMNPSSENLARFLYGEIARRLPPQVRMGSVSVSEKPSSKATYWEE